MKCIVVGAGISGLSCAVLLRKEGVEVEIWAREPPLETTSAVAPALWYPWYPDKDPSEEVTRWSVRTCKRLVELVDTPSAGVTLKRGIVLFTERKGDPPWRDDVPYFGRPKDLKRYADGVYADGYELSVPIAEMSIYLSYLVGCFEAMGGHIRQIELKELEPALAEADVVVNCSGRGARELVDDNDVKTFRGQLVRVSGVELDRFILDENDINKLTYIIPRSGDCVLGGTYEEGKENLESESAVQAILERCRKLEPRLQEAVVVGKPVGLRPSRKRVRLESEYRSGKLLVHNYGHGGTGVTVSWGCAEDVVAKVLGR